MINKNEKNILLMTFGMVCVALFLGFASYAVHGWLVEYTHKYKNICDE